MAPFTAGLPGPVRSKEFPYGFPDASKKEEEECSAGTVMMARLAVIVDAMYKADRFAKENPPPSDVEMHILAWHMPELVSVVMDKVPCRLEVRRFQFLCVYANQTYPWARHFKPQMIGGTLQGIEKLYMQEVPLWKPSTRAHHREGESSKSAAYPLEFRRTASWLRSTSTRSRSRSSWKGALSRLASGQGQLPEGHDRAGTSCR